MKSTLKLSNSSSTLLTTTESDKKQEFTITISKLFQSKSPVLPCNEFINPHLYVFHSTRLLKAIKCRQLLFVPAKFATYSALMLSLSKTDLLYKISK